MPLSLAQVELITNNVLDFYKKGTPRDQHIQERPLLAKMRAKQKTYPGNKGRVDMPVVMDTSSTLQGFTYDDTVNYGNPANVKRVSYPWKLFHIGIQVTLHELLHDGISITDSTTGKNTSEHTDREVVALTNLLEHKIRDMEEGYERDHNTMMWRDGTQSAYAYPGVTSIVVDNPSAAVVVGGIDQSANAKWRNRASLTIALGSSAESQAVTLTLDREMRQLRRYGGRPDLFLAGSDMIDRLNQERRAKGTYTQTGFSNGQDISAGDSIYDGKQIIYDPTLDDLGYSKRLYVLDTRRLYPFVVDGEDGKTHAPARPEDKYVIYRAKTWVGGLACDQRNCHGVYAFA
jgi:hypothetical protein